MTGRKSGRARSGSGWLGLGAAATEPAGTSVGDMFDGLRTELDALGLTPFDIVLPGEDSAVAALEGALRLRADRDGFVLETVDYGQGYRLGRAATEAEARELVLRYVSCPLPPVRVVPGATFLTAAQVRVAATLTPPWFGRPGDGLRFTLQEPEVGLRDLFAASRLQRIQVRD
jgi:hypothetical protein